MAARNVGRPWTEEEDEELRRAVAIHGEHDNWKAVAQFVPGRTNKACRKRWLHSLSPTVKKTAWTAEEDELLRKFYMNYGPKWSAIAREIPGRTDDACSKRYREALDPSLKKGSWSAEEDARLQEAYSRIGSQWTQVGQELGRSGLDCRNRWRLLERLQQRKAKNPQQAQPSASNATPELDELQLFQLSHPGDTLPAVFDGGHPGSSTNTDPSILGFHSEFIETNWQSFYPTPSFSFYPNDQLPHPLNRFQQHQVLESSVIPRHTNLPPFNYSSSTLSNALSEVLTNQPRFSANDIRNSGIQSTENSPMPPVVPQIDDMPADESQVTPQDLDLTEPGFIQLFESRSTLTQPPAVNHPLQQNHWPDQQATCQTSSSGDQGHHDISLETSYDVSITIQNTNGTDATDHVAVPTDTTSFTPETNAPALSPQSSPHPSLLTSPLPHSSAVSLNSSDSAFLGTSQSEYSASPQFSTRAASVPASLEFVGSDGIPSVFGTPFHPVSSLSASSSPGNLPPLDLPVTHSSTDAHNEPSTSTDGLLLAPVQTQDAVAPSLPHSHLVKRTSPKRLHKVINAPRLSSSLTLSSDASVRPYACGREECWPSDAVMGKTCYATAKELFDHMREEHSDDSNGTGDAPFRCALAGCGKSWKSLNGLQYHLQISLAHFRDAVSSTFSRSQASLESEDPGGQASDAPDRTHVCPHPGCFKAYRQPSGLRYHLKHGHPQQLPVQLPVVPPTLAQNLGKKIKKMRKKPS